MAKVQLRACLKILYWLQTKAYEAVKRSAGVLFLLFDGTKKRLSKIPLAIFQTVSLGSSVNRGNPPSRGWAHLSSAASCTPWHDASGQIREAKKGARERKKWWNKGEREPQRWGGPACSRTLRL